MTRVCLITAPSLEKARDIARTLLLERLAACVNLLPGVTSLYWWEGQIQEDAEVLMIVKTEQSRLEALEQRLPQLHPYSVPEFLVLPVESGLSGYLDWVRQSVSA